MTSLYKSPGVHIESAGDRYLPLERVETGVTAFLGVTDQGPRHQPTRIGSFEQYEKVFGAADSHMTHALRGFFDNGGRSAYVVNVAPGSGLDPMPDDFIGQQGIEPRGLMALERIDDVDLVVAPDLMYHYRRSVGFQQPAHVLAVQRAMVDHCERLHERFCLLDPLPGHGLQDAIAWRAHFDSSHASFYFPYIKVRKRQDVLAEVPPSGHIAGLIAQTDRQEGVHRAPANQALQGLVDVAQRLRKRDRDVAFDRRVNTLASFPGRGIRIWGARTLSSDPAFVQINVRRLFILVRRSVEKYAQWVVFEPNEPTLWKKIIRSVDVFLGDLWKEGALVGATQDEAYYVKCDEETNPPEARDAGELVCEIGISPVKPAEFIVVRIHQWTRERTDAPEPAAAAAAAG
ncbi:MAG TPA: phage tail sheath C-terminal domain-containing protein [Myxococcales bacterium]|nr:phage tail sheath C-terminal domain-containing protein [Myxococcales bacterium]